MTTTMRLLELPLPPCGQSAEFSIGRFRIVWQHLREGTSRGVERITVIDGDNWLALLPTRGMGIERVLVDGIRFGWDSPVQGPVHPSAVNLQDPSGLGWLDGFTELLARCGLSSNGAPEFDENDRLLWPLHGRIANIPATDVAFQLLDNGDLEISASVVESRFHFWKWKLNTVTVCSPELKRVLIQDSVENVGGKTDSFQLLYHFNLGPGLANSGASVHIPAQKVVPRNGQSATDKSWNKVSSAGDVQSERVWFVHPKTDANGDTLAVLATPDNQKAAAIGFNCGQGMSCFTLWKNEVPTRDGYVVGLEPGTNWPNPRSFELERGRCIELDSGKSHRFDIVLQFAANSAEVFELTNRCRTIQAGNVIEAATAVDPDWCS